MSQQYWTVTGEVNPWLVNLIRSQTRTTESWAAVVGMLERYVRWFLNSLRFKKHVCGPIKILLDDASIDWQAEHLHTPIQVGALPISIDEDEEEHMHCAVARLMNTELKNRDQGHLRSLQMQALDQDETNTINSKKCCINCASCRPFFAVPQEDNVVVICNTFTMNLLLIIHY